MYRKLGSNGMKLVDVTTEKKAEYIRNTAKKQLKIQSTWVCKK
jgi:hypothetical protein